MIIITGATGQLGSQIVDHLLDRVPPERVAVSVRDPDTAGELVERGVRVRRGDFTEPDTLGPAFDGATQVLVMSTGRADGDPVAAHASAIDAAVAAGASRVLYTSQMAAAHDSHFGPMSVHAATEDHLAATGIPFTALRNGFYANFVPMLIGPALTTGQLVAPADGPVAWTTHADLAETAAALLTDVGRVDGASPPLTAPEALDLDAIATILTEISGRTITRVVVDDDEHRAGMVEQGAPEGQIDMLLGMFRAARANEFAATDSMLEDLLGRPATRIRAVLERAAADQE